MFKTAREMLFIAYNDINYINANFNKMTELKQLNMNNNRINDFSLLEMHQNFNILDQSGQRCFVISNQTKPLKNNFFRPKELDASKIRTFNSNKLKLNAKYLQKLSETLNGAMNNTLKTDSVHIFCCSPLPIVEFIWVRMIRQFL
ncbi:Leucine-rich_repeat [Hexamita inflata]|uniref:Leucine-rich_repeat n=1 Tax=Hexamita inflata TaxID=28002 RepID=A0ABP1HDJ3_9EUKA